MTDLVHELVRQCIAQSIESRSRAVERMLILPGNLGARFYEWIDNTGYHNTVHLTDDVEHMTIEMMPFGYQPSPDSEPRG